MTNPHGSVQRAHLDTGLETRGAGGGFAAAHRVDQFALMIVAADAIADAMRAHAAAASELARIKTTLSPRYFW